MPKSRVLARLVVPLTLMAAGACVYAIPFTTGRYAYGAALGCITAIWVAITVGGRLSNIALAVASMLFCIIIVEIYAIEVRREPINTNTPGYSVSNPLLGWGPQPGVFHHVKKDAKTGQVIFDVHYTIDRHVHRQVISTTDGPTVAFFGDSMTFGTGVQDNETLPQLFADQSGRRLHVVNLAFSGYGPQQYLRALETDLSKDVLTKPQVVVYLTAPWHALRSACKRVFMLRAPRYELTDGSPTFEGACYGQWASLLRLSGMVLGSDIYNAFIDPVVSRPNSSDIDLYIAILVRAGQIAKEKYGAPTVILYLPDGRFAQRAGSSDDDIMRRLRDGGLSVINAGLDESAFPGQPIYIPGDGHPTGVANLARAKLLSHAIGEPKAH